MVRPAHLRYPQVHVGPLFIQARIPIRLTAAPLVGAVNVTQPQCRDDTIQTTQLIQSKGQLPGVARPRIIVEMIEVKNHYV